MQVLSQLVAAISLGEAAPATAAGGESPGKDQPRIGLALGGGGAKGLAHILMLEVFDELGIRPAKIVGSSIGSIIGAMYASGLSAKEIRAIVDRLTLNHLESLSPRELLSGDALRWIEFIDPAVGRGGLIDGEAFIEFLNETIKRTRFEELAIPLGVVTAEFWTRRQVVFEKGALLPAIQASMAVPGVFTAVEIEDRYYVDGGMVNPVPYDLLVNDCDISVAINVIGDADKPPSTQPSYFEQIFGSIHIMQQAILNEKRQRIPPSIYIAPDLKGFRIVDFFRAKEIFAQAEPAKAQLKRELERVLA